MAAMTSARLHMQQRPPAAC